MNSIIDFYNSPRGRWLTTVLLTVIGALAQSGAIPVDYAIPGLGMTVGQVLVYLGISQPAVPGIVRKNTIGK